MTLTAPSLGDGRRLTSLRIHGVCVPRAAMQYKNNHVASCRLLHLSPDMHPLLLLIELLLVLCFLIPVLPLPRISEDEPFGSHQMANSGTAPRLGRQHPPLARLGHRPPRRRRLQHGRWNSKESTANGSSSPAPRPTCATSSLPTSLTTLKATSTPRSSTFFLAPAS